MTTFATPETDDEKNKTAQAADDASTLAPTTAAPAATGGAGAASSAQPTATAGPGKPTSSGSFVDLGKFFDVNKGLAKKSTTALASSLGSAAQGAAQGYGDSASTYAEDVKKYGTSFDPSKSLGDVDQSNFSNIFNTSTIEDFATGEQGAAQRAAINKASSAVQGTENEAGRRQALKTIASQGYSRGEQNLDSILLNKQAAKEGPDGQLANLRNTYGDTFAESSIGAANAAAAQAKTGIQTQQTATREAAKNWLKSQGDGLQGQVDAANRTATQRAKDQALENLKTSWVTEVNKREAELNPNVDNSATMTANANVLRRRGELQDYIASQRRQLMNASVGHKGRWQTTGERDAAMKGPRLDIDLQRAWERENGGPLGELQQLSSGINTSIDREAGFGEILADLASQGQGLDTISAQGDFSGLGLDNYSALRGIAGQAGPALNLGNNNAYKSDLAQGALQRILNKSTDAAKATRRKAWEDDIRKGVMSKRRRY